MLTCRSYYPIVPKNSKSSSGDLSSAAADALGFGALKVRGRDPALIVGLCAGSDSRTISTNDGNLIGGVDLLALARRRLSTLTTLAAALLLREEGGDPGVVDEVHGSTEGAKEDEVQEDAREK